jgi:AraC-like DNA-binding protein
LPILEVSPSPDLAPYVDAYWRSDTVAAARVIPDGCADIIFGAEEPFVVGPMTRPIELTSEEGMFGIRFRPGRAAAALRAPLGILTDARVPLRDVTHRVPAIDVRSIEKVEVALRALLADVRPDPRVDAAVDRIIRSGGRASVDRVAADIGVSRQHLARAFAYHVGVSPKTFARVMRFRRVLALCEGRLRPAGRLRTAHTNGWADLASELGYFDQSHLIAEFREFAGQTPVPFFLSRAE